ncbi:MAG TPA: Crp/Fnr family transcriptional regulator [Solimonas sp.]|nr:Crp/Fnr family transcriptional regulator [Solimonas sp.]
MTSEMPETQTPQQNHLLAALPAEVQARLLPSVELVPLPLGKVLYESGDAMRHVYFPTDSIVSLIYVMENGASAEISMVGKEGVVGISLFMGGESTPSRAVVQSAGYAYRLPRQQLTDEFNRHSELLALMLRYTQSLITQMAQTAVCNRHHSIDQQLCRWLLLSLDRLTGNRLTMTQELIANMLGVRREGVTEAAGKLQKLGVIDYSRGRITVLDRPKLEQLSCECYAVVRKETDRLLPGQAPPCAVDNTPPPRGRRVADTAAGEKAGAPMMSRNLPAFERQR